MRYNLFFLTALLSISLFAQKNAFKKGYFITLSGDTINCLLKDKKRKTINESFKYKLLEDGKEYEKNIEEVKEFGIENVSKFITKNVLVDFSNQLSISRAPDLRNKNVLLKVLIESPEANLYVLNDSKFNKKFFFSIKNNEAIEQLVYKKYNVTSTQVGTNNYYKQQLINNLSTCQIFDKSKLSKVDYAEDQFINIFKLYNECSGYKYVVYK